MSVGFFFKPKASLHCKVLSDEFCQAVACKNGLLPERTNFLAFLQLNSPIQKRSAVFHSAVCQRIWLLGFRWGWVWILFRVALLEFTCAYSKLKLKRHFIICFIPLPKHTSFIFIFLKMNKGHSRWKLRCNIRLWMTSSYPQRIYFCSQLTASLETLTTAHHLYPVWIEMVLRWIWVPRQSVSSSHILSFFKALELSILLQALQTTVRFLTDPRVCW